MVSKIRTRMDQRDRAPQHQLRPLLKLLVHVLKRRRPFEARSEVAYRAHRAQLVEPDPQPCTGRLRKWQHVDRMHERRGRCGGPRPYGGVYDYAARERGGRVVVDDQRVRAGTSSTIGRLLGKRFKRLTPRGTSLAPVMNHPG